MLSRPLRKHGPKAEMNVVPYIDVMLVLLVIFMVTAPMLTQGVKIDLPKVAAQALDTQDPARVITLSVKGPGDYSWSRGTETGHDQHAGDIDTLLAQLAPALNDDTQLYLRADDSADYGGVVKVMAALQKAGARHLGLMTEVPQ